MNILGLEKLSLVDFPNCVAAVIFTGGCNFRCPFCHNAGLVEDKYQKIETSEVMDYLIARKKMLDGVVISGGEPTIQSDLVPFIKSVKEMGYKVKLDTNGTNPDVLESLVEQKLVDYVAMDIKNSLDMYSTTTGIANLNTSKVQKSLNILKKGEVDYELRTTLISNFHTRENIEKMAEELQGVKRLYLQKFVDNENCIKSGLSEVSKEVAEEFKHILENNGITTKLRGY